MSPVAGKAPNQPSGNPPDDGERKRAPDQTGSESSTNIDRFENSRNRGPRSATARRAIAVFLTLLLAIVGISYPMLSGANGPTAVEGTMSAPAMVEVTGLAETATFEAAVELQTRTVEAGAALQTLTAAGLTAEVLSATPTPP